jgi:ACS family hexuronate transporter-like MFS transporter
MLPRRVAWSVVAVATLTMTVSYIDRQTFSVLAPKVTEALGISETGYGWLASAFSIAYLVATPVTGWWIDRVGARRGLAMSVLAWSAIAALHALVPNFAVLFALRIALGLAEGPGFPGAAQTVQRALPPEERARGFGLLFTGSSIGGMVVPPIAARLYAAFGWRVAFLGTAIAGLIWIPMWIAVTHRRDVTEQLELPPAANVIRPRLLELLREPVIIRGLLAVFAAAPVIGFTAAWGAKYLVWTHAINQKQVGDYLWLPPLCLDAGAIVFGDLASRLRRPEGRSPVVLYFGALILASAIAFVPWAMSPWKAIALLGLASAGGGAMYTLSTADMLAKLAPGIVSFAGGTLAGAQSLALIIANPLIGYAVDHLDNYDAVTLTLALCAVPGSLIWIAWRPRPSERLGLQV